MTGRIKYAIIITEVMNMMNKIRNLKLRNTYLLVLFFGLASTFFGGIWVLMLDYAVKQGNAYGISTYPEEALREVVFSAILHIISGIILYLCEAKKVE